MKRRYDSQVLSVLWTKMFSYGIPLALNKCASLWTLTSSLEHLIFTFRRCLQENDLPFGLTPLTSGFLAFKFFWQNNMSVIKHVPRYSKLRI